MDILIGGQRVSYRDEAGNMVAGIVTDAIVHDDGSIENEVRTADGVNKKISYHDPDKLIPEKRQASMADASMSPLAKLEEAIELAGNEAFRSDVRAILNKYKV